MIVFNLVCVEGHRFEGWFPSNDEFQRQQREGAIRCPLCGSGEVAKLPSHPNIAKGRREDSPGCSPEQAVLAQFLRALRSHVMACENVGERFAEEARRIHYGEARARPIRGSASLPDVRELIEEGIDILPLPFGLHDELN